LRVREYRDRRRAPKEDGVEESSKSRLTEHQHKCCFTHHAFRQNRWAARTPTATFLDDFVFRLVHFTKTSRWDDRVHRDSSFRCRRFRCRLLVIIGAMKIYSLGTTPHCSMTRFRSVGLTERKIRGGRAWVASAPEIEHGSALPKVRLLGRSAFKGPGYPVQFDPIPRPASQDTTRR